MYLNLNIVENDKVEMVTTRKIKIKLIEIKTEK